MRHAVALAGLLVALAMPARADDVWAELRGGGTALMRHGGAVTAPVGTLPPVPGCDPGAVLTEAGREEMRRWGGRLRDEGVGNATLLTSRQCSAWETALLLGLGPVRHLDLLDPQPPGAPPGRIDALRRLLNDAGRLEGAAGPTILVTHRANITALTGIELMHGEILMLTPSPGGLAMIGRLGPD